jgi:anti-anti-sigma regulatory factor
MCDQAHVITLRQPTPGYVILDLCGHIGSSFDRAFERVSGSLHNLAVPHVVLNFSAARGIDDVGLKQLLVFCALMRKLNRKLAAFGVSADVRRLFEVTRMDNLLQTCEDEYQALNLPD